MSDLVKEIANNIKAEIVDFKNINELINHLICQCSIEEGDVRLEDLISKLHEIQTSLEGEIIENVLVKSASILAVTMVSPSVFRPYEQHYVTEDGVNRVSWINLEHKYDRTIFSNIFRFEMEDICFLLDALEIPSILNFQGSSANLFLDSKQMEIMSLHY